jgi:murein DD-endopeptidase MepM/ murein hydrolase activator NlpD
VNEAQKHPANRGAARRRTVAALAAAAAALCAGTGFASAQVSPGGGGGTTAPGDPQVLSIQCMTRCIGPATGVVKSKIRLLGSDLNSVRVVSMARADGTRAKDRKPVVKPSGVVITKVGKGVVTGPVRVADSFGQVRDSSVSFAVGTIAQLKAVQAQYRFPVPSKHTYGDGFGAPRDGHSHQGVDIFAPCGTPMVAAHSGVVKARAFQGSAGNYVVIDGAGVKQDYFYAHLLRPSPLRKGQQVTTGQEVGRMAETGNASGCHLHFEIWAGAGWYTGGKPIDPMQILRYWDSFS